MRSVTRVLLYTVCPLLVGYAFFAWYGLGFLAAPYSLYINVCHVERARMSGGWSPARMILRLFFIPYLVGMIFSVGIWVALPANMTAPNPKGLMGKLPDEVAWLFLTDRQSRPPGVVYADGFPMAIASSFRLIPAPLLFAVPVLALGFRND